MRKNISNLLILPFPHLSCKREKNYNWSFNETENGSSRDETLSQRCYQIQGFFLFFLFFLFFFSRKCLMITFGATLRSVDQVLHIWTNTLVKKSLCPSSWLTVFYSLHFKALWHHSSSDCFCMLAITLIKNPFESF